MCTEHKGKSMTLKTNDEKLYDELMLVLKLFYTKEEIDNAKNDIFHTIEIDYKTITNIISVNGKKSHTFSRIDTINEKIKNNPYKYYKRYSKLLLYKALSSITHKKLPWGSLTGIRPTKLLYELSNEEKSLELATKRLIDEFYVSKEKANIAKQIILNQNICKDDKVIDFYINIPFCPTRCKYCSFVSGGLKECGHLIPSYLNTLKYEVKKSLQFIKENCYKIKTIYIGGGTPTSLTADQLDELLSIIDIEVGEFTVESGRPDTITTEKLDVLQKHKVTRICINPQTFSDKTLDKIGRGHTTKQTYDAFRLARQYPFKINMDLIAGLEDEDYKTFKSSLNQAISLNPDNITVHTLSVKKASRLIETKYQLQNARLVEKMTRYSYKQLSKYNYRPYYLYKQKNMIGNLENIGYFKGDSICEFNIDSMEECASIFACGANAISKRYWKDTDRIERWANVKNINEYVNRIDEMLKNKFDLFKK